MSADGNSKESANLLKKASTYKPAYYLKNKEAYRIRNKAYREANKDKISASIRRRKAELRSMGIVPVKKPRISKPMTPEARERYNALARARYKLNPRPHIEKNKACRNAKLDHYKSVARQGRVRDREKIKDANDRWRAKNWDRFLAHLRNRHKTDINFALAGKLRGRLRECLSRAGASKSMSAMDLVGCSIEHLRMWLESKFQPGMSWDNRGNYGWHIDHIIPCSSFDLADPVQQKQCFHYTNLQPLWWRENILKGHKVPTQSELDLK